MAEVSKCEVQEVQRQTSRGLSVGCWKSVGTFVPSTDLRAGRMCLKIWWEIVPQNLMVVFLIKPATICHFMGIPGVPLYRRVWTRYVYKFPIGQVWGNNSTISNTQLSRYPTIWSSALESHMMPKTSFCRIINSQQLSPVLPVLFGYPVRLQQSRSEHYASAYG